MHIFTKLIYAGTLSALLTNALRFEIPQPDEVDDVVDVGNAGDTMDLTLQGSSDFDGIMNGGFMDKPDKIEVYTTVRLRSTGDPSTWDVVNGWMGERNVQAKQFPQSDYDTWFDLVGGAAMASYTSMLAAGKDDNDPPAWWIIERLD